MRRLFRFALPTAVSHASREWVGSWIASGARLLLWPLAVLTLTTLVLGLGVLHRDAEIRGPFEPVETNPASHLLAFLVPADTSSIWRVRPLPDDEKYPYRSDLRLWINGHEMGPAHTAHATIREGNTAGFSHWSGSVLFSLPARIKNDSETIATVRYSLRPPSWLALALAISTALCWLLRYRTLKSLSDALHRSADMAVRLPYWTLLGLCCCGVAASAIFVLSSLYAWATGWALPTTAIIRWSTAGQWAARNEPYFGYLLLAVAGFGAAATWLAGSNPRRQKSVRSDELALRRTLLWCGYPIAACAFLLCISAMWSGIVRPSDPDWANIGGLIPYTDGVNYYAAAHDQAKDGTWEMVSSRRPLAAAFRSALMYFGNYSLQTMLILQVCLFAAAACFAAYAVAIWRGVWSGIAFFGLTHIYAHMFVPTTLTEPLGLFWALLSIPFFIEAIRSGSAKPALLAFAITVIALMTRMGSMFTVPALLVWLVWQFGQSIAVKLRIGVASVGILLCIFGLNSLLQHAYGESQISTGGNFAYTLCGITIASNWTGCPAELAKQGKPLPAEEGAAVNQLYVTAAENFRAHPDIFFGRLADGAREFLSQINNMVWKGYFLGIPDPSPRLHELMTAFSLIGLLYIMMRRAKRIELSFWALLWVSIVSSAALVFFDDGSRVLAATQPLMALFFAMGVSSPVLTAPTEMNSRGRLSQFGLGSLLLAGVLFISVPWVAHRFSPVSALGGDGLLSKDGEAFVFGGRRISGFLVVEDSSPLRDDLPTIHLADFEAIIQQSNVEHYQELLHPVTPPLPFGFIIAPRLEKNVSSYNQFIVPAEVIEHLEVPAWHFYLTEWLRKPDKYNYWYYVTKAEPWG